MTNTLQAILNRAPQISSPKKAVKTIPSRKISANIVRDLFA